VNVKRLTAGKTRKTLLALTGITATAGTALVVGPLGQASAAPWEHSVGNVIVKASGQVVPAASEPDYGTAWSSGWSLAWEQCKREHPETRSVYLPPGSYHVENRQPNFLRPEWVLGDIVTGWICSTEA
jgi:hypothetical protein